MNDPAKTNAPAAPAGPQAPSASTAITAAHVAFVVTFFLTSITVVGSLAAVLDNQLEPLREDISEVKGDIREVRDDVKALSDRPVSPVVTDRINDLVRRVEALEGN